MAALAGNSNFVNLATGAPALIFTPLPASTKTINNLQVFNSGRYAAYIGPLGSTSFNSVSVPANSQLVLRNVPGPVYAMPGVSLSTVNTTVATDATAGSNTLSVGSVTGFAVGTSFVVGNAAGLEVLTVSATAAGSITATTTLLYDHTAGATVATATVNPTLLRINPGVV